MPGLDRRDNRAQYCAIGADGHRGRGMNAERGALEGRGAVNLDEVEQVVEGHIGQATGKEDGKDAVFANGLVERSDEVFLRDSSLLKVLFHELVFAFGD